MFVMLAGWWLNAANVPLAGIGDGGAIARALCVSAGALLVSGVALIAQHHLAGARAGRDRHVGSRPSHLHVIRERRRLKSCGYSLAADDLPRV